ncbi:hypothetical protein CcBV_7.2 [Bracoviriform congregatae]|uniref:Uncharacterized protein n=1 Tax=Bracoviriform congregatae TaxID=39640 RepID=Q5ZP40_9VIRU|nr:hypothetical protein CcBV_7.2 [Bracoviriform congregatae]CAG17416.1 hypothetical protein CcBV_7.2 [Bracoviriform congregatae]
MITRQTSKVLLKNTIYLIRLREATYFIRLNTFLVESSHSSSFAPTCYVMPFECRTVNTASNRHFVNSVWNRALYDQEVPKVSSSLKMVDYFIYAEDCSDSINRAEYYHSNNLKTLEQFKCDVESIKEQSVAQEPTRQFKIVYLNWSDVCWEVNEDKVGMNNYTNGDVTGLSNVHTCERRDPRCLIRYFRKNYIVCENDRIKLLYIVTNGKISRESIDECLELNKEIDYEMVVFHAFNEDPEKIDLLVAAPFFKSRCIVYHNTELCNRTHISKEFDYDKISSDNFAVEMQQLMSYIKLKFINKFKRDADVWREIEKLHNLRNRMLRELSENTPKCPFFERMEEKERKILLRTFDVNKFKNYMAMAYVMKTDVEKYVAAMVNYIKSNKKSCSLDVLKFDSKVNESVEEKQIDDADSTDDEESNFFLIVDEERKNRIKTIPRTISFPATIIIRIFILIIISKKYLYSLVIKRNGYSVHGYRIGQFKDSRWINYQYVGRVTLSSILITLDMISDNPPIMTMFTELPSISTESKNYVLWKNFLSLHKLFIDCVERLRKNPDLTDYLMYVSARKKFYGDLVTLFPSNVLFEMKDMHECYQKVVKKVGVEEFLEVSEPHFMQMKRIKEKERSMHRKRETGFITISFSNFTFRRK